MIKSTLGDYLGAAFNARPVGMLIPPNWIAMGLVGFLGLITPGFWIIGAGLELAYLFALVNNARFRRVVDGRKAIAGREKLIDQKQRLLGQLTPADRERHSALEGRCRSILQQQSAIQGTTELDTQGEGLGRLMWIYLRLLLTRDALTRLLQEATTKPGSDIHKHITDIEQRLADTRITDDLRKSLNGRIDILRQREARQSEARQKLGFVNAELTRIEDQVELIREQAIVSADPNAVSHRIDQIAATLGGTTQWISEQQQMYRSVEDLLIDPPPVLLSGEAQKESE